MERGSAGSGGVGRCRAGSGGGGRHDVVAWCGLVMGRHGAVGWLLDGGPLELYKHVSCC